MNFLNTLEQMPFSIWVRESSSIWAFPTFLVVHTIGRSEERRVGKECRSRWSPYH